MVRDDNSLSTYFLEIEKRTAAIPVQCFQSPLFPLVATGSLRLICAICLPIRVPVVWSALIATLPMAGWNSNCVEFDCVLLTIPKLEHSSLFGDNFSGCFLCGDLLILARETTQPRDQEGEAICVCSSKPRCAK